MIPVTRTPSAAPEEPRPRRALVFVATFCAVANWPDRRIYEPLADEFGWTIGSQWPKFRCRLDVNNAVTESNEDNNETARTFSPLTPSKVPDFPDEAHVP